MLPLPEDILPHRPPMLLLDKVVEASDTVVVARRIFKHEEKIFEGHFPGHPIVPGVYLVEAMAQAMAYGHLLRLGPHRMLLAGVDSARFRHPVLPGQEVEFTVELAPGRMNIYKATGVAIVDGTKVAEAKLTGSFQKMTAV